MKMVKKNNKGMACSRRLMMYRPINTSDEHQNEGRKRWI